MFSISFLGAIYQDHRTRTKPHVKFDVFSNRAVYSRQDLQRFWGNTVEQLRDMRLWKIRPLKLVTNLAKDFFITTSFASSFKAANRS